MKNRNERDRVKQDNPVISSYVETRAQVTNRQETEQGLGNNRRLTNFLFGT